MAVHDPFLNPSGVIPRIKYTLLAGDTDGPLVLTGIQKSRDRILHVLSLAGTSGEAEGTITPVVTGHAAGAYTIVADDDTAASASIATGLTAPDAIGLMVLRAGVHIPLADAAISVSGGNIVLADGSATFVVTTGDIVHWWAYDASDADLTPVFDGGAPGQTLTGEDLTDEFTISDDDEIDNTGGTDTTGHLLLVIWYDYDYGEKTDAPWNV